MATIDKATAAERMIVAAINMVDRGEDALASHLVATSALGLLRDLIRAESKEYVAELLKAGMFALADAKRRGEALHLDVPAEIAAQVEELAETLRRDDVQSAAELSVNVEKVWKMLDYIVEPSNFLKHADRDPLVTLQESDFDPDGAIAHALTAFTFVCPERPLPDRIRPYLERHGLL